MEKEELDKLARLTVENGFDLSVLLDFPSVRKNPEQKAFIESLLRKEKEMAE